MRRRALTLLETLVCGLLISCVILAVVGLFVGCSRAIRHSENQERASRLAEGRLEQARCTPLARLTLGRRVLPPQTLDGILFQAEEEILAEPPVSTQFLKRVRVTVTWTYRNRQQHLLLESWVNAIQS